MEKPLIYGYDISMKRRWWIKIHSTEWREWALLEPGGKVITYSDRGNIIRGTDYGGRLKALSAMKRMGYRRLHKRVLESVTPPEID